MNFVTRLADVVAVILLALTLKFAEGFITASTNKFTDNTCGADFSFTGFDS